MYRSWQLWAVFGVAVAVLAVGGWWFYQLGRDQVGLDLNDLGYEGTQLRGRIAALERENGTLRERLAVLDRSSQIDRQASQNVKQELLVLQEELLTAREELEFYRSIMSPGDVKPGLRIQRFHLEPGEGEGAFRYDLMVTQVKRNDRVARGVIHLKVDGTQDGNAKTLSLAEVTQPAVDKLNFRFRYFQHFEGEIQLPGAFRPAAVRVEVVPSGKSGPKRLDEQFDWPG